MLIEGRANCSARLPDTRKLQKPQLPLLQSQKLFFNREPTAVASQLAIRANDAMARDHDGNRIGSIGQANRTACLRITDPSREFPVRDRLAVRNFLKFAPDPLLKRRAPRGQRKI